MHIILKAGGVSRTEPGFTTKSFDVYESANIWIFLDWIEDFSWQYVVLNIFMRKTG